MMLDDRDERNVQFALDSLRLVVRDAEPLLACELRNGTAMKVKRVYRLILIPDHFELFAHYSPETVGDAVAIALGPPPDGDSLCHLHNGGTSEDRERCADAWERHVASVAGAPEQPGGGTQ